MFGTFSRAVVSGRIPKTRPTASFSRTLYTRKGLPKIVTAQEAVSHIGSFSKVYVHGVAAFPETTMNALAARAEELEGVQLYHLHLESENPCSPVSQFAKVKGLHKGPTGPQGGSENSSSVGWSGIMRSNGHLRLAPKDLSPEFSEREESLSKAFFVNNFFVGANQRAAVAEGRASYIPCFLSEIPTLMRRNLARPDWAIFSISPPDRHGYCSLGVEVAAAVPAAETASFIIAQINPNMPRTSGYAPLHIDCIDYLISDVKENLPAHSSSQPSDVETKIGEIIAQELIKDGATLQMGIGAIPNAVLASLKNHKNLGVHTEMFSDGLIPLLTGGVITNREKTFMPGRTLTSFVVGSQNVYDYVNDNPEVVFMDASITNNPVIIGSNPKATAINAAIEVDLTGQVCADSIGQRVISGVGGQVDFERGAALSEGGIPIICLPSTVRKTGDSRIVPVLKEGAGVTTSKYHTHHVVTEYGHAYLFGKNLLERARALIDIAHPDHREGLARMAFERYKIQV